MSEVRERKCDRRELGQQHRVPRTLVPNLMPWLRSAGHQHYYTRAGASQQACPAPRGSSEPPTSSRRSWTKRRSVSLCRPVCTLTLQISSDAHTHTHTHNLSQCPRAGGADEDEGAAVGGCSVCPAATYVPACCSPGPCFLCSCKMETFERGGNSFYVSF